MCVCVCVEGGGGQGGVGFFLSVKQLLFPFLLHRISQQTIKCIPYIITLKNK